MTNSRRFTEDDKKRFNGTVEHVEDAQSSNSNAKSKFVDVDEKLVMAEGEEKVSVLHYIAKSSLTRLSSLYTLYSYALQPQLQVSW